MQQFQRLRRTNSRQATGQHGNSSASLSLHRETTSSLEPGTSTTTQATTPALPIPIKRLMVGWFGWKLTSSPQVVRQQTPLSAIQLLSPATSSSSATTWTTAPALIRARPTYFAHLKAGRSGLKLTNSPRLTQKEMTGSAYPLRSPAISSSLGRPKMTTPGNCLVLLTSSERLTAGSIGHKQTKSRQETQQKGTISVHPLRFLAISSLWECPRPVVTHRDQHMSFEQAMAG
mmetsp:Transcript_15061/g.47331  ORF Transcript_15061/g.47331 Transcript_15061/m.47331 type:complete len:231 (-) Transcript_15061:275-967(-)